MVSRKCACRRKKCHRHDDVNKRFNSIHDVSLSIGQRRTPHPQQRNNHSQIKSSPTLGLAGDTVEIRTLIELRQRLLPLDSLKDGLPQVAIN